MKKSLAFIACFLPLLVAGMFFDWHFHSHGPTYSMTCGLAGYFAGVVVTTLIR